MAGGAGSCTRSFEQQLAEQPLAQSPLLDLRLRRQDLREGSASEAFLSDDVQLQVILEVGEWTAPRADRNRDSRQLVFVDQPGAGQRLGEGGAAVDQDRPVLVAGLQFGDLCAEVAAEDLDRSPSGLL